MSREPERHGMRCMIRALGETRVEEGLRAVRARAFFPE
jgi:hypothetical protein